MFDPSNFGYNALKNDVMGCLVSTVTTWRPIHRLTTHQVLINGVAICYLTRLPPAGAVARVVRACGRLRAIRRQRSGGDWHVAASGGSSFRASSVLFESFLRKE